MSSSMKPARRTRRVRNGESGGGILAVLSNQPAVAVSSTNNKQEENDPRSTSIPVKPNKLKYDNNDTDRPTLSPLPTTTNSHRTFQHNQKDHDAVPETVAFSPIRSEEEESSDVISEVTMDVAVRHKTKNTTKEDVISPLSTSSAQQQESDQDSVESDDSKDEQSSVDDKQEYFFSEEESFILEEEEQLHDQESSSSEEDDDDSPLKFGTRKQATTNRHEKMFMDDDSEEEELDYDNDDDYDPDSEASDEEPYQEEDESEEFELDDDDIRITQKQSPTKFVAKGLEKVKKSNEDFPSLKDNETSLSENEVMDDAGHFVNDDEVSSDNQKSPSKAAPNKITEELGDSPNHSTQSSNDTFNDSEEEQITIVEFLNDCTDDESVMEIQCDEDSLESDEQLQSESESFDAHDGPMNALEEEETVSDEGSICSQNLNDTTVLPTLDLDDESSPHLNDGVYILSTEDSLPEENPSTISSDQNAENVENTNVDNEDSSCLKIDGLEPRFSSVVASSDYGESFTMKADTHSVDSSSKRPIEATQNAVDISRKMMTPIKENASKSSNALSPASKENEVDKPHKTEAPAETQPTTPTTSLNDDRTNLDSPEERAFHENKSPKVSFVGSKQDLDSEGKSSDMEDRGKALMEGEPPQRSFHRTRSEGIIRQGQWTIGSRIGTGSFGVVHVGMNHRNGSLMAVKSIHMLPEIMTDIRREIDLLKSLKHVNIVRYYGAEINGNDLHIFQEWVAGGSVSDLLSKFGAFPFPVVQSYAEQALCGLAFLHTNNILHRDVKGSNLLVTDSGVVKLADFGGSKRMREFHSDMMMSMTMRGTPYFMAPEVFEQKYSAKADVWAVGCVLYQMATASVPWKNLGFNNPFALCRHLQGSEGPPALPRTIPATDVHVLNHFLALLASCFHRSPFDRPSILDLLQDPFFMEKEYLSDDEHTDSLGLFSPDVLRSRAARRSSPMMSSVKARPLESSPSRRREARMQTPPRPLRNSIGPSTSPFMSSPLPKRCDRDAGTPSQTYSPAKETSDWPSWAKQKYGETNHTAKETSLIDSLAYSTDSAVQTSEDPMQGGSGQSFLNGLEFLSIGSIKKDSPRDG